MFSHPADAGWGVANADATTHCSGSHGSKHSYDEQVQMHRAGRTRNARGSSQGVLASNSVCNVRSSRELCTESGRLPCTRSLDLGRGTRVAPCWLSSSSSSRSESGAEPRRPGGSSTDALLPLCSIATAGQTHWQGGRHSSSLPCSFVLHHDAECQWHRWISCYYW